ncbi:hypothetical protein PtB15_13B571 [Puccinia triticina]|nr:hypothetical protein PtB15_13B571 [Puccinia triticina]
MSHSHSITKGELERLGPGQFLNDNLLQYGLERELFLVKQRDEVLFQTIFLFNTYLSTKLSSAKIDDPAEAAKQVYPAVMKWTKVNIFSKKYLVIPVNEDLLRKETVHELSVLAFDSMGSVQQESAKKIIRYLINEAKEKIKDPLPPPKLFEELVESVRIVNVRVPHQENSFDCGLYVIHYFKKYNDDLDNYLMDQWVWDSDAAKKRRWYFEKDLRRIPYTYNAGKINSVTLRRYMSSLRTQKNFHPANFPSWNESHIDLLMKASARVDTRIKKWTPKPPVMLWQLIAIANIRYCGNAYNDAVADLDIMTF